jgi:hypothetical protein
VDRESWIEKTRFTIHDSRVWIFQRRRGTSANPDGGLAQEAMNDLVAIVFLDEHEFAALWIRALNGEDAKHRGRRHDGVSFGDIFDTPC